MSSDTLDSNLHLGANSMQIRASGSNLTFSPGIAWLRCLLRCDWISLLSLMIWSPGLVKSPSYAQGMRYPLSDLRC